MGRGVNGSRPTSESRPLEIMGAMRDVAVSFGGEFIEAAQEEWRSVFPRGARTYLLEALQDCVLGCSWPFVPGEAMPRLFADVLGLDPRLVWFLLSSEPFPLEARQFDLLQYSPGSVKELTLSKARERVSRVFGWVRDRVPSWLEGSLGRVLMTNGEDSPVSFYNTDGVASGGSFKDPFTKYIIVDAVTEAGAYGLFRFLRLVFEKPWLVGGESRLPQILQNVLSAVGFAKRNKELSMYDIRQHRTQELLRIDDELYKMIFTYVKGLLRSARTSEPDERLAISWVAALHKYINNSFKVSGRGPVARDSLSFSGHRWEHPKVIRDIWEIKRKLITYMVERIRQESEQSSFVLWGVGDNVLSWLGDLNGAWRGVTGEALYALHESEVLDEVTKVVKRQLKENPGTKGRLEEAWGGIFGNLDGFPGTLHE